MALKRLIHFNIWTDDIVQTEKFYHHILGLTKGFRPAMPIEGIWMYDDQGEAVVHIYNATAMGKDIPFGSGLIDHMAFEADNYDEMILKIGASKTSFTTNIVKEAGMRQIFVKDPNGITIELNFFI